MCFSPQTNRISNKNIFAWIISLLWIRVWVLIKICTLKLYWVMKILAFPALYIKYCNLEVQWKYQNIDWTFKKISRKFIVIFTDFFAYSKYFSQSHDRTMRIIVSIQNMNCQHFNYNLTIFGRPLHVQCLKAKHLKNFKWMTFISDLWSNMILNIIYWNFEMVKLWWCFDQ